MSETSTQSAGTDDDWAAALAEQTGAAGGQAAPAVASETSVAPRVEDAGRFFPNLSPAAGANGSASDISLILDIPVDLTVELGRTRTPIKHIMQLAQGSVIELDAMAGEPMDILVNGYLIAQGEVVVVNEKFGIRVTDIVTPSERLRRLNRG